VLTLRTPGDYQPEEGARFEVHFEKSRGFYGEDAKPFDAALGARGWTTRDLPDADMARVVVLAGEGRTVRDFAEETGFTKSRVSRLQKKARDTGLLGHAGHA
jgi:putative DNA primase/helicase